MQSSVPDKEHFSHLLGMAKILAQRMVDPKRGVGAAICDGKHSEHQRKKESEKVATTWNGLLLKLCMDNSQGSRTKACTIIILSMK